MTPQFRITEPAIRDIEQIADYIARKSGLALADGFLTKLDAKFSRSGESRTTQSNQSVPGIPNRIVDGLVAIRIMADSLPIQAGIAIASSIDRRHWWLQFLEAHMPKQTAYATKPAWIAGF